MKKVLWTAVLLAPAPAYSVPATQTVVDFPAGEPAKMYDLTLSVAPQWTTDQPFRYDEVTDSTAVGLTLKVKPKISDALDFTIMAGPGLKLDSDKDDSSGSDFALGGEIATAASSGFSLYGSYIHKEKYTNVFDESSGNEDNLAAGGRLLFKDIGGTCAAAPDPKKCSGINMHLDAFHDWADASDNLKDNRSINLVGKVALPFFDLTAFSLKGTYARRNYDEINATAGYRQRNDEFAMVGGIDIVNLIKKGMRLGKLAPHFKELLLGYRYSKVDSNIDSEDKKKHSPHISLLIGTNF